jgi:thymidylate synthase
MLAFQVPTFTDAAKVLCTYLSQNGRRISTPRTGEFLEITDVTYLVERPTERLLPFESLKQIKLWAYSEVLSEFLNINPPLTESYTNQTTRDFMEKFHRGDGRANYTYGERWHNNQAFQNIVSLLLHDRYSRQAIMNIWDSSIDLQGAEINLPCTIIHQFMIRKDDSGSDKLNLHVYIRSNDFFKGWKYDIFLNSFILEAFAGFVKAQVGTLTFTVGSFHVYKSDYPKFKDLVEETHKPPHQLPPTQQPRFILDFEDLYSQLWMVYHIQNKSRFDMVAQSDFTLEPIFTTWANDYIAYNEKNNHRRLGT